MSSLGPKQRIFVSLAEIAQAIGEPQRLEILEHLAQGERSVEELSSRLGLSIANTSRHLQILRRARLAEPRRDGKRMRYSLVDETDIVTLLTVLGRIGERSMAEVQIVMASYFHTRDALEPISRDELLVRMGRGGVTLLDVRPEDEFAWGHLPGAINIPLAVLEQHLTLLPRSQQIIAYCRGPYCVFSVEAAARLRALGYDVRRLADGYPEWKAAGLPIVV
jgi:ArsR family transcriptional regulator